MRTGWQDFWTSQNEAFAAHRNMPMDIQQDLRRNCGRAREQTYQPRSTRRAVCGVCGLFRGILTMQSSCKRATLTFRFHAQAQRDIEFGFVHPTVCVTRWWVGRENAILMEPTSS